MFERVLVTTDASSVMEELLGCVKWLKEVGSQKVCLLHVLNIRRVGGLYESLRNMIIPKLEREKEMLESMGFRVTVSVPVGVPHVEINRFASENLCSLIVVGSRGESLVREIFLGSVAGSLLHNAIHPILLARLEIIEENGGGKCRHACEDLFSRIFFPTDFSDNAERAHYYLKHIVGWKKSRVTLYHVQDKIRIEKHLKERIDEFNQLDRERLERLRGSLLKAGSSSVNIQIDYGIPAKEIVRASSVGDHSLIVMGTQGRGYFEEIYLGSVANSVARRAPLPVLFIPFKRSG